MQSSKLLVSALASMLVLACVEGGGDEAGPGTAEGTGSSAGTEESGGTSGGTEDTEDTQTDTEDTAESEGDECLEAHAGVARTYDVELLGFAEVGPDGLFTSEGPLDYTGACTLQNMAFAGGELSLELACEHEMPTEPEGARVLITSAATGVPAGLEIGDSLTFEGVAYESEGGLELPPEVSGLISDVTNVQYYKLSDDAGAVFLANAHAPTISHAELGMTLISCEAWSGCSDAGIIGGYVDASVGEAGVSVQIGEVGVLEGEAMSWDLSLFQARLDSSDCHFGIRGGVSVVRRP